MKLSKTFKVVARNGKIVKEGRYVVPMPVTILSAKLRLNGNVPDEGAKNFEITLNGDVIYSGSSTFGEKIVFDPPMSLKIGMPVFGITVHPYQDGFEVSGVVDLNIALMA